MQIPGSGLGPIILRCALAANLLASGGPESHFSALILYKTRHERNTTNMKLDVPLIRLGAHSVRDIVAVLPDTDDPIWDFDRFRQTTYPVHRLTRSILFEWLDNNWRPGSPMAIDRLEYAPAVLTEAAQACAAFVLGYYPGARLARMTLAELPAGAKIAAHIDNGIGITAVHRIHVPIITNPAVHFFIDKVSYYLEAGVVYEFDNTRLHAVDNRSAERRVHLMCDLMPTSLVV